MDRRHLNGFKRPRKLAFGGLRSGKSSGIIVILMSEGSFMTVDTSCFFFLLFFVLGANLHSIHSGVHVLFLRLWDSLVP